MKSKILENILDPEPTSNIIHDIAKSQLVVYVNKWDNYLLWQKKGWETLDYLFFITLVINIFRG